MARFSATTVYNQEVIDGVVEFRNTVYTPSQGLQQFLLAAVFVALGFVFVPGPLRYGCWILAAITVAWQLTGKWRKRFQERQKLGKDVGSAVQLVFEDRGFNRETAESTANTCLSYKNVVAIFVNDDYLFLRLRNDELHVIDKDRALDNKGNPAFDYFLDFLERKTGQKTRQLDSSFKARMRTTQNARREYVEAKPPGISTRIANAIRPNRNSAKDQNK